MLTKRQFFLIPPLLSLAILATCTRSGPAAGVPSPSPSSDSVPTPSAVTATLTPAPQFTPRPEEQLLEEYQLALPSELPRWGLGCTSLELLTQTVSDYGHYPNGEEFFHWEASNYYLFDRSPAQPEALAVAVLYAYPEAATLETVLTDFGSSLSYREVTPFGRPCYAAALGDVEVQFLLDGDSLWGVLLSEPGAELPSVTGLLRDLKDNPTAPAALLSSELRAGEVWVPVNNAAAALGRSMEELRSAAHIEEYNGPLPDSWYETALRDTNSGTLYISWDGICCQCVRLPARLAFPEQEGVLSSADVARLWDVPYRFSYYEDYGYWAGFEDLSFCFHTDFFTPSQGEDWVILIQVV